MRVASPLSSGPIGAFDSGLGGLTVIRELRRRMPNEQIVYVGDTANVPYGGRPAEEVCRFSIAITQYLLTTHGVKAVMVPCNTATSAAVPRLREQFSLPIIGTEPGVKPAARLTKTGTVAVLATAGTLGSDRFARLVSTHAEGVSVLTQPCPRWVELVEAGQFETEATYVAVREQVLPLIERGADVLVLGCTHFPVLTPIIQAVAGPRITILDTTEAIVRRAVEVVPPTSVATTGSLVLYTTGNVERFQNGVRYLLGEDLPVLPLTLAYG